MNSEAHYPLFPMLIDVHGKHVLVVGGGHVAARRATTLIKCGANVHAVSPNFIAEFPECTERINREFKPQDIDSKFMFVIAATDSRETNQLVHDIAKSKGIFVNVSDNQQECDFFFPSLVVHDIAAVSVNTSGTSPSLTRRLSDRLRDVWASWVEQELRQK